MSENIIKQERERKLFTEVRRTENFSMEAKSFGEGNRQKKVKIYIVIWRKKTFKVRM